MRGGGNAKRDMYTLANTCTWHIYVPVVFVGQRIHVGCRWVGLGGARGDVCQGLTGGARGPWQHEHQASAVGGGRLRGLLGWGSVGALCKAAGVGAEGGGGSGGGGSKGIHGGHIVVVLAQTTHKQETSATMHAASSQDDERMRKTHDQVRAKAKYPLAPCRPSADKQRPPNKQFNLFRASLRALSKFTPQYLARMGVCRPHHPNH